MYANILSPSLMLYALVYSLVGTLVRSVATVVLFLENGARVAFLFVRRRAAKGGIMVVVLSLLISVFIGAILVNKFEGVIDDARPGASLPFNNTVDDIIDNTWTVFIFLALGIIIVGAAWILRQTGLLG